MRNGGLVALTGPPCRFLEAASHHVEQATYMPRMRGNAKFQADDYSEASGGPDLAPDAIGFGAAGQELGQAGQLCDGQPGASTRRWPMAKGLGTSRAGALHPLADGPLGEAHCLGNLALGPAALLELPGLQASRFSPIVG
jgi:hypothetical protein